jgi:hypothetical protein
MPVYIRRLLVLVAIGCAHILLLWWGDVTCGYAIGDFGLILFSARARSIPDVDGFSSRDLKYMRAFAVAWPSQPIVQQHVCQASSGFRGLRRDGQRQVFRCQVAKVGVGGETANISGRSSVGKDNHACDGGNVGFALCPLVTVVVALAVCTSCGGVPPGLPHQRRCRGATVEYVCASIRTARRCAMRRIARCVATCDDLRVLMLSAIDHAFGVRR